LSVGPQRIESRSQQNGRVESRFTLLREAQSKTVRLVLDAMPRPLREILVLRELEELSYRQISEITDLPIGTVMSRLARARSAFGDAWRREVNNSD
jgi:RNA polymerase sigma factor (sigma-70 family)